MRVPKYHEVPTPVEQELNRRRHRNWLVLILVLLAAFFFLSYVYSPSRPTVYADDEEHFKYGSVGSDIENGLPLAILKVLPRMFPEYLPEGAPKDLTAFGFIQEPGRDRPIGFSKRRRFIDLVGFNCAACHVGVVRENESAPARIVVGAPANTVNLHAFLNFMFACAADNRFNPDAIVAEIRKDERLNPIDRFLYRYAVSQLKAGFLIRKAQFDRFLSPAHAEFGPGRVDTFNPYKVNQFSDHYVGYKFTDEERFGTVDFPSVWNQHPREGMNLHWDGDNDSVGERNFSAAFGAGATRENIDIAAMNRVKEWIDYLPPPPYPFAKSTDAAQLARGKDVYAHYCAECHAFKSDGGKYTGQVTPLADIGTDEHRFNSYTTDLVPIQRAYGKGYPWEFTHFHKTDGYANAPLDGVWARAPYLHNGSVPTLYDLLTPAEKRNGGNPTFFTGHGVYDTTNVGFRADVATTNGRKSFVYVVTEPGNSNKGHTGARYGTELSEEDKRALIEYMKTL
ncbi:MAG TPA: cytochrome c [Pyrinomonadaceae bacterium]|jgi:mono/diheme cytochrome c family protein|nr:cytochrome c [Pyrinomonadaceae bacterium]